MPPGPEGLPLPSEMLAKMAATAEFAGKPATPDAGEVQKMHDAFKAGTNLLIEQNPDLLQTANPAILASLRGKKIGDKEITDEVAARKTKREDSLKKDIVVQEKKFKDMPVGTDEEIAARDKAIEIEIQRRQKLQVAFDRLYAVNYACTAANRAVEARKAELKAQVPQGTLTPEDETALRATTQAKYRSGDSFYMVDDKGEPITDQTFEYNQTFEPVYSELIRTRDTPGDDGQTTEIGKTAAKHLTFLRLADDKKSFNVISAEEKQRIETEKVEEQLLGAARDALENGLLTEDIFKRDENGKITGIDHAKLEKFEPDEKMAGNMDKLNRMAILLGTYYDGKTTPEAKLNLTALIYHELGQLDPTALNNMGPAVVFVKRYGDLLKVFRQQYLEPSGLNPTVIPDNLLGDLLIASVCEGHMEKDANGQWDLNKQANDLLSGRHTDTLDRKVILHLAHNHSASLFLVNELGFNLELMESESAIRDGSFGKYYAERAANAIQARHTEQGAPLEQAQVEAYRETIAHNLSTDGLAKIAEKVFKLNSDKLLIFGGVAFLITQILQGLAEKEGLEPSGQGRAPTG